jgi:hypothetical protein
MTTMGIRLALDVALASSFNQEPSSMVNKGVRILSLFVAISGIGIVHGFAPQSSLLQSTQKSSTLLLSESKSSDDISQDVINTRRTFLTTATIATSAAMLPIFTSNLPAYASGGATAGKYTTIPIAKRRYYGRVQEAVHEFLLMAPAVIKGDLMDPTVQVRLSEHDMSLGPDPFQFITQY